MNKKIEAIKAAAEKAKAFRIYIKEDASFDEICVAINYFIKSQVKADTVLELIAELERQDARHAEVESTMAINENILQAENQSTRNVLAVIHRDGGHYTVNHGYKKSADDAIHLWYDLQGKNKALREQVESLDFDACCPRCRSNKQKLKGTNQ